MCIVGKVGCPDLFITMTCNPSWPDIRDNLKPGQSYVDRPDLVARVFRLKFLHFWNLMIKQHYFGEIAAGLYIIEFQKRGLPHAHCLFVLKNENKIKNISDLDDAIWAHLPDKNDPAQIRYSNFSFS